VTVVFLVNDQTTGRPEIVNYDKSTGHLVHGHLSRATANFLLLFFYFLWDCLATVHVIIIIIFILFIVDFFIFI
jgi:hypothetical protein